MSEDVSVPEFGSWDDEIEKLEKGIEPGDYSVQLHKWEYATTKAGKPMLKFIYRVVDDEEFDGKPLTWFAPLGTDMFNQAIVYTARAANAERPQFQVHEFAAGPGGGNDTTDWLDALLGTVLPVKVALETKGDFAGRAKISRFLVD